MYRCADQYIRGYSKHRSAGASDVQVSDGMMGTADAIVKCHCCGCRSTTTRPDGQIAARTHWPSRGESDIFVFRPRSTPPFLVPIIYHWLVAAIFISEEEPILQSLSDLPHCSC